MMLTGFGRICPLRGLIEEMITKYWPQGSFGTHVDLMLILNPSQGYDGHDSQNVSIYLCPACALNCAQCLSYN